MREFSLSTTIKALPDSIWSLLVDFEKYEHWNTIVPYARGSAVEGTRLDLKVARPDGRVVSFRPVVIKVSPNQELILAATVLHKSVLHMFHYLTLVPKAQFETILNQHWISTGIMLPILWSKLKQRMERFAIFGNDLKSVAEA